MDSKSLDMLEFPRIRQILAGLTSFSASRTLALDIQPSSNFEQISLLLQRSAETRHLLMVEPTFSIGSIGDIREAVKMAAIGKVMDPTALIEVQNTVSALRHLRSNLKRVSHEFSLLWSMAENIIELKDLEKEISGCLTPAAELLDSASTRLLTLRQELRDKKDRLSAHFDAIVKSNKMQRILQEPLVTEREGRFVIPVKIELRKEVKGIVHDVSNTGATVFIEPWATVEMGNEVRELVIEERHEVERILAELSAKIGAHEQEIALSIELAAEIDLVLAKARYAQRANATEPVITRFNGDGKNNAGVLRLIEARHPLIGQKAVPLTVEIGRDFKVLVITGPNTGGKTVALKTVGLLSAMTLAGIPIPAAPESVVPVFDGIFADIGDEQSIEQTLSTFSWHISNITGVIGQVTGESLVLLDELGTSTDPAEGSALARSILLHFLSKGTMTVATTHFSDLKAFAHATPGLQNASLDFNPATLAPTYHLTVGVPGGSNALATASRLGLPEEIINKARDMLAGGTRELEALLSDMVAERRQIADLKQVLQREKDEAEKHNNELKNELQRIRSEERRIVHDARDKVTREAAELHRAIRDAEADLKREKTKEKVEQAKKALAVSREQLKGDTWQVKGGEEATDESEIKVGDAVLLRDADVRGTVLSLSEETREIEVQAGATRLSLSLDSVDKLATSTGSKPSYTPVIKRIVKRDVPLQLDLRGKRAEEIEPLLDGYLNDASLASLSEVRIIHGIGTGVVRRIVRDYLAAHPLVKSFRSGGKQEGGDGATMVSL